MRFQERFDLPDAIHSRDNEIAIAGTDTSSGRAVTVHLLLHRQNADTTELLKNISSLSGERRQQVLDQGEYEGIPYVVTYPLPNDSSLRAWMATPEVQRPAQVLRPAGYKTPEPGEFTRLFQARTFEPLGTSNAKTEDPPPPATSPSGAEPKPGEFTALLRSFSDPREKLKAPTPEVRPPAPVIENPVLPPPPTVNEPGEFTRMMRSPLAPETSAPTVKSTPKQSPGEFTRLVQGDFGLDAAAKGHPFASPAHQPPPPETPRPAGEFTRMLDRQEPIADDLFSRPAPARSPLPSDGFATGAFSSPPIPSVAPAPSGPSEFTRLISSPVAPSSPPTPTVPTPAVPQAKETAPKLAVPKEVPSDVRTSYVPLIIILVVLLVVGAALVAYFVMHR